MEKPAILLPWIKTFILIILLVLLICSSPGTAVGFKDGMELTSPPGEVIIQMKARKLIGFEALLDYQDPSANPTHDPKIGGSGGRGGNNP